MSSETPPPADTPTDYAAYHQRMIAAIRVAMFRRWPPTTDAEREQLERNIAFFDTHCTYEEEMARGDDPEEIADDEIDAATLAAAQWTAQRLAKFEDDELHKSVVRDLPGHPVYAPCALEGCQYDDVATVAQGTARHLSELEDIRRCLHLCPTHELTPMWEDGKSTCLICEYLHAEAAYAALREHNSKLMDELMALEQKWCTDAKEEARRLYSEKTTDWLAIRTLEGRTKEDCAAALRAVLQGTGPT